ncbi:MAG TPA: CDP-alcohol phosphatidyltransferase family protein [Rhizomicrobium sp.]|jgi:phosphatidylglycerophosphate synthase
MLDEPLRKWTAPLFTRAADALAWRNIRPSRVVIAGFLLSIAAFPAIMLGHYILALVLIAVGRSVDGLGGAVRRQTRSTDLGDFLDIALEYIYCAAIPFAFALADPSRALAACFFVFSFTVSATTFLAYSKFATRRGIDVKVGGVKGASHLAGLTDGAEAFIAFTIACIHPEWFGIVAYVFGIICFVSAGFRFAAAFSDFPEQ